MAEKSSTPGRAEKSIRRQCEKDLRRYQPKLGDHEKRARWRQCDVAEMLIRASTLKKLADRKNRKGVEFVERARRWAELELGALKRFAAFQMIAEHEPSPYLSEIIHVCYVCEEQTRSRCGRCRVIFYCGPDHQKDHWPTHRLHCRK